MQLVVQQIEESNYDISLSGYLRNRNQERCLSPKSIVKFNLIILVSSKSRLSPVGDKFYVLEALKTIRGRIDFLVAASTLDSDSHNHGGQQDLKDLEF